MLNAFTHKLRLIVTDPTLRVRILFVLGALAVFRLLAAIPIPGIDAAQLSLFLGQNQFLGLLNIFSGGGLANLSVVMLGVGPYITASIIMQLMTVMSPRLKAMYQEEGEAGRTRFSQYSRLLTIPLALLQAYSFLVLLERQGVLPNLSLFEFITNVMVVAGGSILLMWIGELITEFGIGNGVSLIIFSGIVAGLPSALSQLILSSDISGHIANIPTYLAFFIAGLLVIAGVVIMTEAERAVPVTYAKKVRGTKVFGGVSTYLPLRLNQGGVIPIIFGLSILLFPQMLLNFATTLTQYPGVVSLAERGIALFQNTLLYGTLYFLLVFMFTYFYTAVTFDPDALSKNLQKNGAFIPGVRPGEATSEYIGRILTRITLVGALFLGIIAVLPIVVQAATQISSLAIGGTALLIAVSVTIDLIRKIDAQISIREY